MAPLLLFPALLTPLLAQDQPGLQQPLLHLLLTTTLRLQPNPATPHHQEHQVLSALLVSWASLDPYSQARLLPEPLEFSFPMWFSLVTRGYQALDMGPVQIEMYFQYQIY